MNPWIAFVPGLVLGILLGALLFRRARRRETVVPAAGPAPSVADPSRGIFIPGRNFPEIKRLLIALQTSDKHSCATPADWQPGEDVIVPPPGSCGTAKRRVEKPDPDAYALDWFMTFKKLPKEKLGLPAAAKL